METGEKLREALHKNRKWGWLACTLLYIRLIIKVVPVVYHYGLCNQLINLSSIGECSETPKFIPPKFEVTRKITTEDYYLLGNTVNVSATSGTLLPTIHIIRDK